MLTFDEYLITTERLVVLRVKWPAAKAELDALPDQDTKVGAFAAILEELVDRFEDGDYLTVLAIGVTFRAMWRALRPELKQAIEQLPAFAEVIAIVRAIVKDVRD